MSPINFRLLVRYLRLNRDRMRGAMGDEEALEALQTLYSVLLTTVIYMVCEPWPGHCKSWLGWNCSCVREACLGKCDVAA